jgi:hypothetical protein
MDNLTDQSNGNLANRVNIGFAAECFATNQDLDVRLVLGVLREINE